MDNLYERIEIVVEARIMGFCEVGETKQEAQVRIAIEAERRVNNSGTIRMHIHLPKEIEDGKA